MRFRILVRTCHLVPRRRRLAQLLQFASAVVPLDDWLPPSLISAWNHPDCVVSGGPVAPRFFDVNMAEWKALCRRMLRSGLGRKFIQRHVLLVPLVEHLPSTRTLIGTDSSVTSDLEMARKDSLERIICLGLHDSDVSCRQAIVSSAFIFVMFQIVTTLIV